VPAANEIHFADGRIFSMSTNKAMIAMHNKFIITDYDEKI